MTTSQSAFDKHSVITILGIIIFTYVLLDGSGIKLLEVTSQLHGGEDVSVEGGVQPLMETKIPYYLAIWLDRMLFRTTSVNCESVCPPSFCIESINNTTDMKKAARRNAWQP